MRNFRLFIIVAVAVFVFGCQTAGKANFNSLNKNESKSQFKNDFVLIPGGTFMMGSPDSEPNRRDDETLHEVTLKAFYISKYDVTFDEYDKYILEKGGAYPKDNEWGRGNRPVINVQWVNAIGYCNWRSHKEGLEPAYEIDYGSPGINVKWNIEANGYRLPTEAEWEYAAKGGPLISTLSPKAIYAGCENSDDYAWYSNNSNDMTHPVGEKKPNILGLYDMSGNVWQFVWDGYAKYPIEPQNNPRQERIGKTQLVRGGSFYNSIIFLRSSIRDYSMQGSTGFNTGFRLSRN